MPLYDYSCSRCGRIYELLFKIADRPHAVNCHVCGGFALRRIAVSGVHCANDDAPWVRTVVDVVDKKSQNPATREFIKNPTRSNLDRHLKANGLRHADKGEKFGKVGPAFDVDRHTEKLVKYRREKNAIRING